MKALVLNEPRQLHHVDLDEPGEPGEHDAIVRVHRVGICGTDISGYLGKMPFYSYPRIPGHELGVEVLQVGAGVEHIKPGDKCAIEPYINCGDCHACRKGASNCCANLKVLGVMIDGGMRERFTVPARKLHVGNELDFEQLALVETLAIGCHAVDRTQPVNGENCLVVGAGPIGLATLEFVKLTGARSLVMDLNPGRLDFCTQVMGIEATILGGDDPHARIREACGGELPDIVIDATGNARSMSEAFSYIAPTGKLVFVGITTETVSFKHTTFHRPEGTLLCSRNALPHDFSRIIKLIADGRIDTAPWVTHRTTLAELTEQFPSYTDPATGVIKAMVEID